MPQAHPVDVLLLDADGVLQYMPQGWASAVLSHPRWPGLPALLEVEAPFLTGERREGFPSAVETLLRDAGMDLPVSAFFESWSQITADEEALALVERVRSHGVRAYLASNQQSMRAAVMRERGLYAHLDGEFYSFEMGVKKPDPAFFHRIVHELRVRRDRVLFVDDTLVNVVGARAAGLRAVHKPYAEGAAGLARVLGRYDLL